MIPRIAFGALLHTATIAAVCTKLEDCPQYEALKTTDCQPYHHFLARGSTSPYPGHVIETVGKVCDQLNNATHPKACGYEDVEYWAMNGGDRWCISAHEGAVNGAEQMRNYTQRCPDSHLIVMGFSQGGSVQLDVLGGGGGLLWGCTQEDNPAMNVSSGAGAKGMAKSKSLQRIYSNCNSRRRSNLRRHATQRKPIVHVRWRRDLRWRCSSNRTTTRWLETLRRQRHTPRVLPTSRPDMRTTHSRRGYEISPQLLRQVGH